MPNPNFDAIISTTLKKYTPRLEDNIFKNLPLLYFLKEADHIVKVDGGEQIVEPLLYAQNSTAGSYSGYDNIDTTPQEGITSAVYDWKQFAATVAIAGIEEAKNRGETKVIELLQSKVEQAELTISERMNEMLFGDGTGNGSRDWLGLAALVAATGTVGGIDRSTDAWWAATNTAIGGALTVANMGTLYNTISRGRYTPDFVLTNQAQFQRYEALLQPQLRYSDTKTADAGFQNLLFKTAPVMFDPYSQTGILYMLNSKNLKLKVHSDVWFKPTPFKQPPGQDARYSQILCYGNLCTNNSRFLGKLSTLTDP